MNFDYDTTIGNSYGQPQSYPYPLGWNDISYGFYDGSNGYATKERVWNNDDNKWHYNTNVYVDDSGWRNGFKTPSKSYCPEWGFYGILNTYVEGKTYGWNETGLDTPNDNEEVRMNSKGQKRMTFPTAPVPLPACLSRNLSVTVQSCLSPLG